jgi:hypothetical protein
MFMKTQEVLWCEWNSETEKFDKFFSFLDLFRDRIESFFTTLKEESRVKFYEVHYWDIGQLHQYRPSKYWGKDENVDREIFEWYEYDDGPGQSIAEWVLTKKGNAFFIETLKSCFVPGYWTIHQVKAARDFIPARQKSLLLFKTEADMKQHLCAYPCIYDFCIDPNGVKFAIQTEIQLSLVKNAES